MQAQPGREVDPAVVMNDDVASLQRRRLRFPARDRRAPARREIGEVLLVGGRIRGIELAEAGGKRLRDDKHALRVHLEMRIATRMHVTVGAVELRRFLQGRDLVRCHERARAGCDLRIARLPHQLRQPADLEIGAGTDDQVGAAHLRDQARLGLDHVHVLQRGRADVDIKLVAAEFGQQRTPFRFAGEHLEVRMRRRGECAGAKGHRAHHDQLVHRPIHLQDKSIAAEAAPAFTG